MIKAPAGHTVEWDSILTEDEPDTLLAWEMNGEPLRPIHGAPLRVVVPGFIGARSVKWLESIELRSEPSDGYFQAVAYRLLPPDGIPGRGAAVAANVAVATMPVTRPLPQ